MDISNIQGLGNGIGQGSDNDDALSLSQAATKPAIQKSFADQFKAAAQAPDVEPSDLDQDVVSDRISYEEIQQAQTTGKSDQQSIKTAQSSNNTAIPDFDDEMVDSLITPDSGSKKLDKQAANQKAAIQEEAEASEGEISVDTAATAQSQLNAKALRKAALGTDKADETTAEEEVSKTGSADAPEGAEEPPPHGGNEAIATQQKLFSLNLRSSLKFLRDQKSFAQKFLPEVVAYDEETGCINGSKTLEMLGWQGVTNVRETYFSKLNNDQLNAISTTQDILRQASRDGHDVFKGIHPVFATESRVIAVEKLTGELTIISSLVDLGKLQVNSNVLNTHNISE